MNRILVSSIYSVMLLLKSKISPIVKTPFLKKCLRQEVWRTFPIDNGRAKTLGAVVVSTDCKLWLVDVANIETMCGFYWSQPGARGTTSAKQLFAYVLAPKT